jgi:hypothetical protein
VQNGYTVDLVQSGGYLDVAVRHDRKTLLAGAIGFMGNGATASARVLITPTCAICILHPTMPDALYIENAGALTLDSPMGEGILVNSSSPTALHQLAGAGSITTLGTPPAPISVVGGYAGGFTTPVPVTGVAPAPDPLANLPVPPADPSPRISAVDVADAWPGVYDQLGLETQTTPMTLHPGTYVVTGRFYNNSPGRITGTGVTIYLTCSNWPASSCANGGELGAGINIQSTGGIDLHAPTSGTYQGVAIFMDRNNTATVRIQSQGTVPVTGTIYGVSGTLTYTSNGPTAAIHSAIVMGRLDLQSAQSMLVRYEPAENSPYLTWARNRDLIR